MLSKKQNKKGAICCLKTQWSSCEEQKLKKEHPPKNTIQQLCSPRVVFALMFWAENPFLHGFKQAQGREWKSGVATENKNAFKVGDQFKCWR